MLAKRIPTVLPRLTSDESIETTRIYSSVGRLPAGQPSTTFPSDFMLVATLNPCPCGYRTDPRRSCNCAPHQIERYMSKIQGPLLDRIDIHVEVPAAEYKELASTTPGTSSAEIREQVIIARKPQAKRFPDSKIRYNGR